MPSSDARNRNRPEPSGLLPAILLVAAAGTLAACTMGDGDDAVEATQVVQRLPSPIFDGLDIDMTRAEVQKKHVIRPSRPSGGRNMRVWLYDRRGDYTVRLTFSGTGRRSRLQRIDVHFGWRSTRADEFIARYERKFGEPDERRRRAIIPAYGDAKHDQLDTIWSDASRYVHLTEKVPAEGRKGRTAYFLTVKEREIAAAGPPTGYVPPPPPEGQEEEPLF
jgi:hypothetical protein